MLCCEQHVLTGLNGLGKIELLLKTERPRRASTSKTNETVARVCEIILNNRRFTIKEVVEEVEISYGSCQEMSTKGLGNN